MHIGLCTGSARPGGLWRAGVDMFAGHNLYLVALSVAVAIAGGYTGFGLAARLRGSRAPGRRVLLAGAAAFLALGIWTMHFVGMLAAPIPVGASYLVLPTIVSFLICALVVGVSLFLVGIGEPSGPRIAGSAILLGAGIVSMHYVGIHGLVGGFRIEHDAMTIVLAVMIAVGTAYGGLRIFLARHMGRRLAFSAIAFGIAVSGMHYTAMSGMRFTPAPAAHVVDGLTATADALSLVVAFLCFLIVAGFLLFLVPEPRPAYVAVAEMAPPLPLDGDIAPSSPAAVTKHQPGPASAAPALRLPVQGPDGTRFIEIKDVRSIRADAHYTLVHDGSRERMCPWSISETEARLDPASFLRVHRSHIVALPHVVAMRKEGDGAVVELNGPSQHLVPVSRARVAELKARLGLARRESPTVQSA